MHSAIYYGQLNHSRNHPVAHIFNYSVFMAYLDLSELDVVFNKRWFWSTTKPAIFRFRRSDHVGDVSQPLDKTIRELVKKEANIECKGPIRLLTNLAYLGYCFNPISIYYCFDQSDSRLQTIVAEVTNTPWKERHCYVIPVADECSVSKVFRYNNKKSMHVSPFMGMDVNYDWLIGTPGRNLLLQIKNEAEGTNLFSATLNMQRKKITGRTLATTLLRYPFWTARIMLAIHYQAFRLWLKKVPVYPHPGKRKNV